MKGNLLQKMLDKYPMGVYPVSARIDTPIGYFALRRGKGRMRNPLPRAGLDWRIERWRMAILRINRSATK